MLFFRKILGTYKMNDLIVKELSSSFYKPVFQKEKFFTSVTNHSFKIHIFNRLEMPYHRFSLPGNSIGGAAFTDFPCFKKSRVLFPGHLIYHFGVI